MSLLCSERNNRTNLKSNMLRVIAVAFLVVSVLAQEREITYDLCADPGNGKLVKVTAKPCSSDPCVLKKGTEVTYRFEYISDQDSATAQIDARVNVLGMKISVPGLEPNLCKEAIKCPISKGEQVHGSFTINVPNVPIRKGKIEVKVIGDKGVSSCFTYNVILS